MEKNSNIVLLSYKDTQDQYYRTINLTSILDKNLSLKAKAAHIYLMTRPDGWRVTLSSFKGITKDGQTSIRSAINNLIENHYLCRVIVRDDSYRVRRWIYLIFTKPCYLNLDEIKEWIRKKLLDLGFSDLEKLDLGFPNMEIITYSSKSSSDKNRDSFSINRETSLNSAEAEFGPPEASQDRSLRLRRRSKNNSNSNKTTEENNPITNNSTKTNYLESYPHEDVKSIFRYWCQKSPPLIKHSPTSKICLEALEAINWAMNSGATEHRIRHAIDNYAYLLSTNTKVKTAAMTGRLGWKIGLNEFFTFSDFTVKLAEQKKTKLPVESWFLECLNDREELMMKYGNVVEDKVPLYTKQIRKYWQKIMKKKVIEPDEENAFRKAAVMLDEFRQKKGLAGDKTFNLTKADDMVRLLFEAIERDVNGNWALVTPGWLVSKKTYQNRLTAYLIDLGYEYYGAFNDVDSVD